MGDIFDKLYSESKGQVFKDVQPTPSLSRNELVTTGIQPRPTSGSSDPGFFTQMATSKYKPLGSGRQDLDEHLRLFQQAAAGKGLRLRIRQIDRSDEEQARAYASGRTVPGPILTNASPGMSLHSPQRHMAFDADPVDERGNVINSLDAYRKLAEVAKDLGFIWGGDFVHLKGDIGHFELPSKASLPSGLPTASIKRPEMKDNRKPDIFDHLLALKNRLGKKD